MIAYIEDQDDYFKHLGLLCVEILFWVMVKDHIL